MKGRRNVYDKNPRRYAKENRTAHLTARRDKPVAYVAYNKRLYSTFCATGRHEASRGLFVTAELLVIIIVSIITQSDEFSQFNIRNNYSQTNIITYQILNCGFRDFNEALRDDVELFSCNQRRRDASCRSD